MKGYLKVLIISCCFLCFRGIDVLGVNNSIIKIHMNNNMNINEEKIFLENLDMNPGDEIENTLIIENNYDFAYSLYMSAKRITNEEEYDLLKVIDLKVSFGDELIYKGPIINEKSEEKILLGVFEPNSSKTFKAVATLRDGIGDEYKDKYARVDWLFIAEGDDGNSITSSNQINLGNNIKNNNKTNLPRTGEVIRGIYFAVGFIAIGILLLSSKNDKKKFKN
ncbi:hypothetical protein [Sarcina ventriculi]|uniref:hypothetical protein n=1 Tax=Sarcina ventriculi TaxID=1267 RepID=UPI0018AB7532|nr:hypothetical protein [Sarcina ventriculi]